MSSKAYLEALGYSKDLIAEIEGGVFPSYADNLKILEAAIRQETLRYRQHMGHKWVTMIQEDTETPYALKEYFQKVSFVSFEKLSEWLEREDSEAHCVYMVLTYEDDTKIRIETQDKGEFYDELYVPVSSGDTLVDCYFDLGDVFDDANLIYNEEDLEEAWKYLHAFFEKIDDPAKNESFRKYLLDIQ